MEPTTSYKGHFTKYDFTFQPPTFLQWMKSGWSHCVLYLEVSEYCHESTSGYTVDRRVAIEILATS